VRRRALFTRFDKLLFFTPIVIFLIGILSVYSASYKAQQPLNDQLAARQFIWMAMGILVVFLVVRVSYFRLVDAAWPLYFISLFFLVLVLFTPARMGAHRWISIGGFNFQPSELAKISVILVLARYFSSNRIEFMPKARLIEPFVIVGVPFLLILKEPDLGTGLILVPIFLAMIYVWGMRPKFIFGLMALGAAAAPVLFHFLKEYQRNRIFVFMNPNLDPLGSGYTIIQSKIAIGSGGLFGKGYMGGTQNQLKFLPEKHTDFIFGVIGEEGGFIAACLIIGLFWLIIRRGYQITAQTPDRFGSLIACGITTMLAFQVFVNLGMTMGILPVVGVPLPLVSYGGTSVLMTMFAVSLLINIKIHRSLY
jgi:rod shape determining protein RodA